MDAVTQGVTLSLAGSAGAAGGISDAQPASCSKTNNTTPEPDLPHHRTLSTCAISISPIAAYLRFHKKSRPK
ncbi:MAG: hypothetical protein Q8Q74_05430, partial [Polaromonas sp.]|nr:hypothetical protein [Polaromonas sp.]